MKHIITLIISIVTLITVYPANAQTQTPEDANLKTAEIKSEEIKASKVKAIESYLQNLKTAQARFVQTTHDGTQLVGTFYLSRPGKLRFEYDAPIEDFVVADGLFIYFYDAELQEQTNAPIGQTLADFFLQKDLSLDGDISVKEIKRGGGYLQATLVQTADPQAGTMTLGFKEDPLQLNKWRIIDAQGLITEIELFYLKTDIELSKDLFIYKDPKKEPYTYNE